jgi:hypothetical protein
MGDLIWIGNTLYPRGLVILAVAIPIVAMIVAFVWLTED